MREQKANDNGFPVVGKQVKEQQTFPFDQLVKYDGATNKITINANLTINGDTNIGELDIDSGDAPKGQVLTADGESGASWENRVEYLNLESESGNLTDEQIEVAKQDNVVIQLGGQFYYKNSQSDESIVFKAPAKVVDDDTIVEKVVVDLSDNTYSYSYEVVAAGNSFEPTYDDELNDSSTNAPQTKVVYEALEEKADVEDLDSYAKKDGYYESFGYARRSGVADNLFNEEGKLLDPNVSESAGTVYADQPFVQRATAMSMNAYLNDELISVASGVEEWKKDEAFSIVRNNQIQNGKFNDASGWSGDAAAYSISFSANKATMTALLAQGQNDIKNLLTHTINEIPNNNKVLFTYSINTSADIDVRVRSPFIGAFTRITSGKHLISIIGSSSIDDDNIHCMLQTRNVAVGTIIEVDLVNVINLTQWFASRPAIATALTGDNGVKWFLQQYPQTLSLDYDDGTIIDTETYEYQTTGVNLWNEEWELGAVEGSGGSTTLRSKNYIRVFPNTEYYIKCPKNGVYFIYDVNKNFIVSHGFNGNNTFTTEPNACYMLFRLTSDYGTTYKNDIQICNHFTETHIEQTYHKFEIHKDTVDWSWTSTGKGKSAGSAADTKDYVLGKNIEKVEQVDLGTLDWSYNATSQVFTAQISGGKGTSTMNIQSQILCAKYSILRTQSSGGYPDADKVMRQGTSQSLVFYVDVKDSSYTDAATFKAAMSGVILNFELATPIEYDMVGDEVITTVEENDYGNESKVPASGNMFSGSATTILYQDNVLRQIYNNKNNIDGLQEDVNKLEAKIPDAPTTDGTYILKATVSGGVATYSWVLEE